MSEQATHDVDGLLRKNAELLAEVKSLKARVAEIEGERDAALDDAATSRDAVRQVSIERPLEAQLGGAFVAPWRVVRPLLDEHFDFALDDAGAAVIRDNQGEAIEGGLLDHLLSIPDLAAMLKPAQGGGARGSDGARNIPDGGKAEPRERVASPFGLR